ncbi:MAG: EAL domain-containing protein, partial [Myxococcales bacterium]
EEVLGAESSLRGLVVEVTEHRPIADPLATTRALSWLRERGALIALDDAGAGHAGLQQILLLRPSFLKLDRSLVDGIDRDEAKVALVEMLGVFASRIDAWLLAEGVETEAEARRLNDLGVPLAQGYFYGRPAAPWAPLAPGARDDRAARSEGPRRGTLHSLLEVVPWVHLADLTDLGPTSMRSRAPLLAVLDADMRPVSLVARETGSGEPVAPFVANVNSTVRELAHRLATRSRSDLAAPVLVTDNAGRYLGVITMTRLLTALADP